MNVDEFKELLDFAATNIDSRPDVAVWYGSLSEGSAVYYRGPHSLPILVWGFLNMVLV